MMQLILYLMKIMRKVRKKMSECEKYEKLAILLLKTLIKEARVINTLQDYFDYENESFRTHLEIDSVLPLDELEEIFEIDNDKKRNEFYNETSRITDPNIEIDINQEVNEIIDKYLK